MAYSPREDEARRNIVAEVREMSFKDVIDKVLKPAGVKVGGFPEELFVSLNEEEKEKYTCNICYLILNECRECSNHHKFCSTCVLAWSMTMGDNSQKCPLCRCDQDQYLTNQEVDSLLKDKLVRCQESDCSFQAALRYFLLHSHGRTLYNNAGLDLEDIKKKGRAQVNLSRSSLFSFVNRANQQQMTTHGWMMGQMMLLMHLEDQLQQHSHQLLLDSDELRSDTDRARRADRVNRTRRVAMRLDDLVALSEQLSEIRSILSEFMRRSPPASRDEGATRAGGRGLSDEGATHTGGRGSSDEGATHTGGRGLSDERATHTGGRGLNDADGWIRPGRSVRNEGGMADRDYEMMPGVNLPENTVNDLITESNVTRARPDFVEEDSQTFTSRYQDSHFLPHSNADLTMRENNNSYLMHPINTASSLITAERDNGHSNLTNQRPGVLGGVRQGRSNDSEEILVAGRIPLRELGSRNRFPLPQSSRVSFESEPAFELERVDRDLVLSTVGRNRPTLEIESTEAEELNNNSYSTLRITDDVNTGDDGGVLNTRRLQRARITNSLQQSTESDDTNINDATENRVDINVTNTEDQEVISARPQTSTARKTVTQLEKKSIGKSGFVERSETIELRSNSKREGRDTKIPKYMKLSAPNSTNKKLYEAEKIPMKKTLEKSGKLPSINTSESRQSQREKRETKSKSEEKAGVSKFKTLEPIPKQFKQPLDRNGVSKFRARRRDEILKDLLSDN